MKQRLVGAIVLIALAVIFLPMLLDGSGAPERLDVEVEIPERREPPASQFEAPDVAGELEQEREAAAAVEEPAATETETPAATGWVVQVGSFSREANAVVLRDRLRQQGRPAFVAAGSADGQAVWRVRVGPVPEEAEAREIARELEAERGQPALVMSHP
ncbi:MAG: SPOR domain-containing protein [Halofilum sp. (in: g-proteobacteria)]|nr:SPOR domain-containing protein [Halofilum sp. (in: g-proteobacteria)]